MQPCSLHTHIPRQMEAQANTTREQSNKKNIYDVGWQTSHGKKRRVGKTKKIPLVELNSASQVFLVYTITRKLLGHFKTGFTISYPE